MIKKYNSIKTIKTIGSRLKIDWTKPVRVEEKYDGSNMCVEYNIDTKEFTYFSRRDQVFKDQSNYKQFFSVLNTDKLLNSVDLTGKTGIVQFFGEFIGKSGQSAYGRTHTEFIVFEVKINDEPRINFDSNLIRSCITTHADLVKELAELGEVSKIDGLTPIEGYVIKQDNGAQLKIVSTKLKENRLLLDREHHQFTDSRIHKYITMLVETGTLDQTQPLLEQYQITQDKVMLLVDDLFDEEGDKHRLSFAKSYRKTLGKKLRLEYLDEDIRSMPLLELIRTKYNNIVDYSNETQLLELYREIPKLDTTKAVDKAEKEFKALLLKSAQPQLTKYIEDTLWYRLGLYFTEETDNVYSIVDGVVSIDGTNYPMTVDSLNTIQIDFFGENVIKVTSC